MRAVLRRRPLGRLLLVLALVAGVLLAVEGPGAQQPADAANLSLFQAGNIISDAVFWNPGTMGPSDIQAFLNARNPSCVAGSDGTPCLKYYTENTWTRPADAQCGGPYIGAGGESAATIIWKVAQACGINPQVLIVMLQKEQGLVTDSGSSLYSTRYRSAMGYGCPDTSVCDSQYYGFFNQVYNAAHQMDRYADYPSKYSYQAGAWNSILYNPDTGCGSSSVYISNQATAGLYNYTPYQPDAAALAAGYGKGDYCSSYGNRNFFAYFTDWFGTTGAYTTGGAIGGYWTAWGGGTGYLGYPASNMFCGLEQGGCGQHFENGSVYWTPALGAHGVSGAIRYAWSVTGWQSGVYGYPTSDMTCTLPNGGCIQSFQGGQIIWSDATGAHGMTTGLVSTWQATGGLNYLGYPTSDIDCTLPGNGCSQTYQGGQIYWSPATGAHAISAGIGAYWTSLGGLGSSLGYPVSELTCTSGGCDQLFAGGQIGWTSDTGNHLVNGAIGAYWAAQGAGQGSSGYPVQDMTCGLAGGGCKMAFQNATIYWSAVGGAHAVSGELGTYWAAQGAENGPMGYPTSDPTCTASGCSQWFERGFLAGSASLGFRTSQGAILGYWLAHGGGAALGYPTSDVTCTDSGCNQQFEVGTVYWSPGGGTHLVTGDFRTTWTALGGTASYLGYPTGDAVCGLLSSGCRQNFGGGTLVWSPTTGSHPVTGGIGGVWAAMGAETSSLGYPTADMTCTTGGCAQAFQGGSLGWTNAMGVRLTGGAIGAFWNEQGAGSGKLGYPAGDMVCGLAGGGCRQPFQAGTVYWSPASGAHAVVAGIGAYWFSMGADRSSLGYPTAEMVCAGVGCSQQFQNGSLTWSNAYGYHVVSGGIGMAWVAQGGLSGAVGAPKDDQSCSPTACSQTFTGGVILHTTAYGSHPVTGPIYTAWVAAGGTSGSLGYPKDDAHSVSSGTAQDFQGGTLTLDSSTGVVTRS